MLAEVLSQCNDCTLRKGCRGSVPGCGADDASIMLVGEAPGEEEDKIGQPFVGKSGRFLSSLLGTLGLSREEVYITNTVRCRPPHNSDPKPEHIRACAKWLEMELEIINPRIVVALGRFSTNYLLNRSGGTSASGSVNKNNGGGTSVNTNKNNDGGGIVNIPTPTENYTMEHVHGVPFRRDGRIILPAYHPAAGMHNTTLLRQIYDDFKVLGELLRGAKPESLIPKDEFPEVKYREITNSKIARELLDSPEYALDIETVVVNGVSKVWSMQVAVKPGEAYFISYAMMSISGTPAWSEVTLHNYLHDASYLEVPKFLDTMVMAYLLGLPQGLKELASRLCGMNMRSYQDVTRGYRRNKAIEYLTKAAGWDCWPKPKEVEEVAWDNKVGRIATKIRNPQPIERKIKKILATAIDDMNSDPFQKWNDIDASERLEVERILGPLQDADLRDVPRDEAVQYSNRDADATLRVRDKMTPMIEELGLVFVLKMADLPTLPVAKEMMRLGMPVDKEKLTELSAYYGAEMEKKVIAISRIIGKRINPNSSMQVAEAVYGKLRFQPTKMTAANKISTDDNELRKIRHPIIKEIIGYRQLAHNKDSFSDMLILRADKDSRVHTTIKTTRTETGRWSSSEPTNLQQIPVKEDEGRKIRTCFVAPDGWPLIGLDYSQQEIRVMAHESRCKRLINIFRRGEDVHTATSMQMFGLDRDTAAQDKYRRPAKGTTFGVIYGITDEGLYSYMIDNEIYGWSTGDCQNMINEWYKMYPEVKDYRMEQAAYARRHGYVKDMFGRIRYVPEIFCPIKSVQMAGERQAGNMPIQGGCATMTKIGMVRVWESRKEMGWEKKVKMIMQIHDELLLEVVEGMEMKVGLWAKKLMEGVVELLVPIVVDVKVGKNWGEMKKVEYGVKV